MDGTLRVMAVTRSHSLRVVVVLLGAGGLLVVAGAVLVLGLTPPFVLSLLLGLVTLSIWAVNRLRVERAQHEAALARWEAAEAVIEERLRLARDLHDIVSHGLGMITVRTAAATHLYARMPDEGTLLTALHDVEAISRTATVELRRMLDALRDVEEQPALHPADTLACLPEIVDGGRRVGLRVDLHQEELGSVSPGAQVAICRVVREGLANSARYAGSTHVDVRLTRDPTTITVTVEDEGPDGGWSVRPGAGHGLVGLRERVGSLGGVLVAEPRSTSPSGRAGFSLAAMIPEVLA